MRPRITLKLKLIVVFSLLYAILMSVFIYIDLTEVHRLIEGEMKRASISFTEMLSVSVTSAISADDISLVQEFVLQASKLPYVKSIIIQDSNNTVIAGTDFLYIGNILTDGISKRSEMINKILLEEVGTPPKDLLHKSGHAFSVVVPIYIDGRKAGLVRVETFSRELNQKITDLGNKWVLFTMISIFIGGLAATMMAWAVTRELAKLVDSSRKIAAGDLTQQVHIKTRDELRILGDAFNHMASRLRESHSTLENQVRARTAELFESKRKLEALFDGITDLISVIDPEYNIIMANHAIEKMMKQTSEEIIGNKCFSKYFQVEELCENCPVKKTIETKKPAFSEVEHFGEVLHLYTYPIMTDSGELEAVIEFGKIITKEKILKEQLVQSAKLASLGEMASSVAHEIRNPLAGIKSGVQFIEKRLKRDERAAEVLEMILGETNRLEEVVTSFLSFASPSRSIPVRMNITKVIERALSITEEQIVKQKIGLTRNYEERIPEVTIDGKQMQQVFLNMIINALQAMSEGGKLEIETFYLNDKIQVRVKDTGVGISRSNISRIFEPFFTTRAQGTGLGLSIIKRIIEEHGGAIEVESEEGKGTTFSIELAVTKAGIEDEQHTDRR